MLCGKYWKKMGERKKWKYNIDNLSEREYDKDI